MKTKLAGVSFPNEDGESRQDILKNIFETAYSGSVIATPVETLYEEEGNRERAVKIVVGKKCVGFVPRAELRNYQIFPEHLLLTVYPWEHDGEVTYCGVLSDVEKPTMRQKYAVDRLFRVYGKPVYLAYDKSAYARYIAHARAAVLVTEEV